MKKTIKISMTLLGMALLAGCGEKPTIQTQSVKSTPLTTQNSTNKNSKTENQAPVVDKIGIKFSTPANGTVIQTGSKINVAVELKGGIKLKDYLMIMAPGNEAVKLYNPPYATTFNVPVDAYGDFAISALGGGVDGNLYSDTIKLSVDNKATLQKIDVSPLSLFLNLGMPPMQISVNGTYSDGTIRDLSKAVQGTKYASGNEKILSVDENGLVTPKSTGVAFVGVTPITGKQIDVRVEIDKPLE